MAVEHLLGAEGKNGAKWACHSVVSDSANPSTVGPHVAMEFSRHLEKTLMLGGIRGRRKGDNRG